MSELTLRGKTQRDQPLVFSSFLKSVANDPSMARLPSQVRSYNLHRAFESLWDDPSVAWIMAVAKGDPGFVMGWMCGQILESHGGTAPIVHYVYTKKAFRRLGVATGLLFTFGLTYGGAAVVSFRTTRWDQVARKMGLVVLHNPFVLLGRVPVPGAMPAPHTTRKEAAYNRLAMKASRERMVNIDLVEDEEESDGGPGPG